MSAWLSNLLTIPGQSLYLHDALHAPVSVTWLAGQPHAYKGIVDTGAALYSPTELHYNLTVIDADPAQSEVRTSRMFGRDMSAAINTLRQGMESLKAHATVYHADQWPEWIAALYETHTGCRMDWGRYEALMRLNIQSQESMQWRANAR